MHTPFSRHFITNVFSAFILLMIQISCSQKPASTTNGKPTDTVKVAAAPVSVDAPINDEGAEGEMETATYYLIEVATGYDFDSLKSISSKAASILGSKFNMLDRIYKPGKGIIVPESSDDEIYRGEYYPRRASNEQDFVSIEMSYGFTGQRTDTLKMIALAGMYLLKTQADSVASLLKDKIPTTKIFKQELYLGCMH